MPPTTTNDLPAMSGEGVEPQKKIRALEEAISEWRSIVEKRQALTEKETEAIDRVTGLMHKHGVTKYRYWIDDDTEKLVVLEGKEKLKMVKAEKAEEVSETDVNDD